jgi:hypothetical protein
MPASECKSVSHGFRTTLSSDDDSVKVSVTLLLFSFPIHYAPHHTFFDPLLVL